MPIRRAVNSKKETAPKNRPAEPEVVPEEEKKDAEVSSEESASTGEDQETETPPATSSETEQPKDPETEPREEKDESKPSEDPKKDEKDSSKEKEKKVKKTIPVWATLSATQLARARKVTHLASSSRPKMDAILTEAIKACFHKGGASVVAIRKYIIKKYPSLDLERRGYLLKQALKRELQRGMIRQVKGKGASGSFVVVPNAGKAAPKSKGRKKNSASTTPEQQNVKLEDILPLAFTRICEPKEASYGLIKKYVAQYYPKLNVDARPHMLKNALQRAVEKGQLEQITGKGASGTFQLKRSGDKPLLGGSLFEDAILSAITAMNEPKTCSTTAIKKYVLENHPATNSSFQVHLLKRTLQKCERNGWLEQISGKGFSGTYMLSFPYYPNPDILFPDRRRPEEDSSESEGSEDESEEEESSSEEESEDDEPPPKKRMQKTSASRGRTAAPPKRLVTKPKPKRGPPKPRGNIKSTPKKAPPTPSKKAKTAPLPAKKPKAASTPAKKPRPAPAKKPAGSASKKLADEGKASKPSSKGKTNMRKSLRGK